MTKRRKEGRARESAETHEPVTTPDEASRRDATAGEARESFAEETSADQGSIGDAMETRDRHRKDERLSLDALDDIAVNVDRDDLPADAIDEIALSESPEDYETMDSGDRRAHRDDAEMAFGGEAHSPEEIAELVLGHEIPGRGTTRDGEAHGLHLGLE